MLVHTLKSLFTRDLNKLKREIESYIDESNLWKIEKNILNSGGNLCLHLIGNLNTYIGKEIGKIDYTRNREAEFSLKNISRNELLDKIDDTLRRVNISLDKLDEKSLLLEFPVLVFDQKTSTEYFLVHLSTHLGYHLGQINYHRRLLDS